MRHFRASLQGFRCLLEVGFFIGDQGAASLAVGSTKHIHVQGAGRARLSLNTGIPVLRAMTFQNRPLLGITRCASVIGAMTSPRTGGHGKSSLRRAGGGGA